MADEATQDPAETQGASKAGAQEGAGKTFTQDQVNEIVEQRLSRTKAQFKDYDELKQSAARLAELEAQNQSEFDKLRTAADKARQQAQEASEREQRAMERVNSTLLRAAVISEASRQQAIDPDAVFALINKDQIAIEGDEVKGVEDAVTALLEERSYLIGARPSGGFDGGARQSAPAESSRADLNARTRDLWRGQTHRI